MTPSDVETRLDELPPPLRGPVEEYVNLLEYLASDNWLALTVYGRAVRAGTTRRAVIRNILVLEKMDLNLLRLIAGHGGRLGKLGVAAPVVMTPDYLRQSCDTFPLELLEVSWTGVTVRGSDYYGDLSFASDHLRLQCERELKVLLIGMRQGLLASGGEDKFLEPLEADAGEALTRVMRGMLEVKGVPADDDEAILAGVESLAGPIPGIRMVMDPDANHGWHAFTRFYRDIERLGDLVDGWS